MLKKLQQYRRDLHMIPELGHKEFLTHKYILNILKELPCKIEEFSPTGMVAFFQSENPVAPGSMAFRADMDALPIEETNSKDYASTHKGMMHACGHDGHMAMLLGFGEKIAGMLNEIPYDVLLIFQPAEESPGGAKDLVETGFLDRYNVKRIFALHLNPSEKPGTLMGRPLEMMARASELTVDIFGKSAHIASSHKGIDALYIACQYMTRLYEMEKTALPSNEFRLLKFGKMTAGTARNTLANHATLEGSFRAFSDTSFNLLKENILKDASRFEEDFGCDFQVQISEGYPAVINDPELFSMANKILDIITLRKPSMTSEDFSYYLKKVPGLYLFLGTGNSKPLHSSDFDFDEEVLSRGVEVYLKLLFMKM